MDSDPIEHMEAGVQNELYLVLFVISLVTIVLLLSFVIYTWVNQRKIKRIQRALISAEIDSIESERKRFAADLHDEIGPLLSSAIICNDLVKTSSEADQQYKEKVKEILKQTISRVRDTAYNITPNDLVSLGLVKAVNLFAQDLNYQNNVQVEVSTSGDIDGLKLSDTQQINLYRIIQESTNNALKHSKATKINIRLQQTKKELAVIIIDNGNGFSFSIDNYYVQGKGMGLKNIHNRVTALGGNIDIISNANQGTRILVEVPTS